MIYLALLRVLAAWLVVKALAPMLVNSGKDIVTNRLKGSGTEPNHVAIGTGSTAEALTQTALVTEVETRVAGTSTRVTTTTTNDTYQVVGTITATAQRLLRESGLFDAASAGNMLVRGVFALITLESGDSIQLTWKLQFT